MNFYSEELQPSKKHCNDDFANIDQINKSFTMMTLGRENEYDKFEQLSNSENPNISVMYKEIYAEWNKNAGLGVPLVNNGNITRNSSDIV